jgi:hypothetical protein
MAFELRELSGVAFREDEKRSEKAPDWKGKCLVNGQPHELAMWIREGKRGEFLSFKIGPARERTSRSSGDDSVGWED